MLLPCSVIFLFSFSFMSSILHACYLCLMILIDSVYLLSHAASPNFPTLIKIASRFIELICYDLLSLSICMFLFIFVCFLMFWLLSSTCSPLSFFFVLSSSGIVLSRRKNRNKKEVKSWKKEKRKEKKRKKKGQMLVMSFRAWWLLLICRYTNSTHKHTLISYFILSYLFLSFCFQWVLMFPRQQVKYEDTWHCIFG